MVSITAAIAEMMALIAPPIAETMEPCKQETPVSTKTSCKVKLVYLLTIVYEVCWYLERRGYTRVGLYGCFLKMPGVVLPTYIGPLIFIDLLRTNDVVLRNSRARLYDASCVTNMV